jgi:hypothetical protein
MILEIISSTPFFLAFAKTDRSIMSLLRTIIIWYLFARTHSMTRKGKLGGIYFHGQIHSVTVVQPSYDLHHVNLVRPTSMP